MQPGTGVRLGGGATLDNARVAVDDAALEPDDALPDDEGADVIAGEDDVLVAISVGEDDAAGSPRMPPRSVGAANLS